MRHAVEKAAGALFADLEDCHRPDAANERVPVDDAVQRSVVVHDLMRAPGVARRRRWGMGGR